MQRRLTKTSGSCITNVFATRRKNFSQWHRSFQRKLLSHWLKFLRHGPGSQYQENDHDPVLHKARQRKNCRSWTRSLSPLDKTVAFRRRYFQMQFYECNVLYFGSNFTRGGSLGSNWQQPSIGLNNGLAPNRRQAIVWINADLIQWRLYVALRGDELTCLTYFMNV